MDKIYGRVHRVGAVTAGLSMIGFGVMFLLSSVFHRIPFEVIIRFWPLILISLGIEILISTVLKNTLIYDKGAVFLMIIMSFFAMCMGVGEMAIQAGVVELIAGM